MADWTFTPDYPYRGRIATQRTLTSEMEDFSEVRVEKGSDVGGQYTETYRMTGAELASALSFFATYRMATSFTKLTYDPADGSFDADDPASASGPSETVRFAQAPTWNWVSLDNYTVSFTFKRLRGE